MKKLRCKKELGTWFYKRIKSDCYNDLDGDIYELYNSNNEFVGTFGSYEDMKYYLETGIMF